MTNPFPLKAAQVQATLASIAYAGDTLNGAHPSLTELHSHISHELNCGTSYATGTEWSLVWGPVVTNWTDNLLFAALNAHTKQLAIVIRGTTGQTLSRLEDVPRYQAPFPDPKGKSMVSGPFLEGLKLMLAAKDKWHNKNLKAFFDHVAVKMDVTSVVVTGHSQGAALVPMMMVALQEGLQGAPKLSLPVTGFAFAPPTSGNRGFAEYVDATCDCWFVINPKDVVPLGYDAMSDVISKGIPEDLHGLERDAVAEIIKGLNGLVHPDRWAQPKQQALLEAVTLTSGGFFGQIDEQHNHNGYIAKLGAQGTDVGNPSPFPVSDPPVVHIPDGAGVA